MRVILPILILVVGVVGTYALVKSAPQREPLEPQEKAWLVAVREASVESIAPQLTLYGRVDSPRVARLSAAVEADVTEVVVLEGERVASAQPLVTLDDRETRLILAEREADLAEIRAQIAMEKERHRNDLVALEREEMLLELSRKEVSRAQDLARKQVGSRSQLDQARQAEERNALAVDMRKTNIRDHDSRMARLEASRARAESLRDRAALDLERTRVTAPFDGRVTRVEVSAGDRVRPGNALVSLYDTSALEIRAQVPVRYLPLMRSELTASRVLTAQADVGGVRVEAQLDRLAGEVTRGSGGADALFRITSDHQWLPLGRTVKLVVDLPTVSDVVALPYEAIYGTSKVYLLDGDRMRGIEVERRGERYARDGSHRVLVHSPELTHGARIIVTQLPNAIDGLRVSVAE